MVKRKCSKCKSANLSFGKIDPEKGTPVKCNECGNLIVINHQDYDDESMGKLDITR
jgi:DNA-directed RNA polymerase subunit RPC12/RpoP|tara:strand:+ start:166 stop:333 length:168 start_codon:yes stop_codon:yes gene_type:complete